MKTDCYISLNVTVTQKLRPKFHIWLTQALTFLCVFYKDVISRLIMQIISLISLSINWFCKLVLNNCNSVYHCNWYYEHKFQEDMAIRLEDLRLETSLGWRIHQNLQISNSLRKLRYCKVYENYNYVPLQLSILFLKTTKKSHLLEQSKITFPEFQNFKSWAAWEGRHVY